MPTISITETIQNKLDTRANTSIRQPADILPACEENILGRVLY